MTNDPSQIAQQRAMQYGFIDGSVEFFLGGLCLLLGVYFYGEAVLPAESLAQNLLSASMVLVIVGGTFAANRMIRAFKERVTYPRSGYVAYRRAKGSSRILRGVLSGILGMLISGLITALITNSALGLAWMPAITGIVFGVVLAFIGLRSGLLRMFLLALLAVVIGGGLMLLQAGDMLGLAYFYGAMAVILLLSGLCTLWNYLRSTPLPETDDEP